MKEEHPKVLITGISGFVASHTVREALKHSYRVRGTVRDLNKQEKIKYLSKIEGGNLVEICCADLLKRNDWFNAVEGCDYVIHIASPFPLNDPQNENEVIMPAIIGTKNILNACKQYNIKKLVIVSSIASIQKLEKSKKILNENDWTDPINATPYMKSKYYAEKIAWDFYTKMKNENKNSFELTIICPGMIFGECLTEGEFTSGKIISKMLRGSVYALPKVDFSLVDVEDVAYSLVKCLETPQTNGRRIIITNENMSFLEIANILKKEFNKFGYKISTKSLSTGFSWILSFIISDIKSLYPFMNIEAKFDNTLSKQLLNIQYHPVKKSIIRMAHSLIDKKIIPDLRKFKPKI